MPPMAAMWRALRAIRGGAVHPPATLVCKRLRLCRPSRGKCRLRRLCGALTGAMERGGLSYRQLRSLTLAYKRLRLYRTSCGGDGEMLSCCLLRCLWPMAECLRREIFLNSYAFAKEGSMYWRALAASNPKSSNNSSCICSSGT